MNTVNKNMISTLQENEVAELLDTWREYAKCNRSPVMRSIVSNMRKGNTNNQAEILMHLLEIYSEDSSAGKFMRNDIAAFPARTL
jgi:hypothetical protein